MESSDLDQWLANVGEASPLTEERLALMFQLSCKLGPPNCWVGESGTAAAMIRELLRERSRLLPMPVELK